MRRCNNDLLVGATRLMLSRTLLSKTHALQNTLVYCRIFSTCLPQWARTWYGHGTCRPRWLTGTFTELCSQCSVQNRPRRDVHFASMECIAGHQSDALGEPPLHSANTSANQMESELNRCWWQLHRHVPPFHGAKAVTPPGPIQWTQCAWSIAHPRLERRP